jgi:pantoate--beta-alanine ligase
MNLAKQQIDLTQPCYMIIFRKIGSVKNYLSSWVGKDWLCSYYGGTRDTAIDPASKRKHTLCSIFVNPTQFNDPQDFQKYPVVIESDIVKLEKQGCDLLFLPHVDEIYPQSNDQLIHYDIGHLEQVLEGKFRPGHFQGVCRVVDILLDIVAPHRLYLGQKDFQQCMVIRKMIELTGKTTELRICPTIRERDGLAMSSRNMRLSAEQRQIAPTMYAVLSNAKNNLKTGDLSVMQKQALEQLEKAGFRPDYFEFADADTLDIIRQWNGRDNVVALVAAFLGDVRLIDNMILSSPVSFN